MTGDLIKTLQEQADEARKSAVAQVMERAFPFPYNTFHGTTVQLALCQTCGVPVVDHCQELHAEWHYASARGNVSHAH